MISPDVFIAEYSRRWDELIAAGILRPPIEAGDPFEHWPTIRLSRRTTRQRLDADRVER